MSYIVPREKPKDCEECPFCDTENIEFDYDAYCVLQKKWFDFGLHEKDMYKDCSLIEVPTPHGRLIDADALVNNCEKYIKTLNPDRDGKEIVKIRWLVGILNEQPTVIEAEGSVE